MRKTRTILLIGNERRIELSVNPSELTVADSMNHGKANIPGMGDITISGNRGLKEVTISTFLPAAGSPFRKGMSQKAILKQINAWKVQKTIVRMIISNPKINFEVLLKSTRDIYKEGQKDLYIEWGFQEYRRVSVPTVASIAGKISVGAPALKERTEVSAPKGGEGRTEVVTKKTTLWALAQKYYGNGSLWKKISAANGNVNPRKLREGRRLVIPA